LLSGILFLLEFKVGASSYDKNAIDQVTDYALDLMNFHEGSHNKYLVPILVSTKAVEQTNKIDWAGSYVAQPLLSNGHNLNGLIGEVLSHISAQPRIDAAELSSSGYRPTPTIVEAAQALYREHSVKDITRADAGAANLTKTLECISEIVSFSKAKGRKSICFVTGVPGSGKTLAGLNIATIQKAKMMNDELAVYLSGNGPLVKVLREALARDTVRRAKEMGEVRRKESAAAEIKSFIQNVHHFRDDTFGSDAAPAEYVIVFDEAQRAWTREQAEKFMRQQRGEPHFGMSEPEFLISVMDRKQDWCTIVCLIGGGQEINTGEAGLVEWFNALQNRFNYWDVYYSDQIKNKDYSWGQNLTAKLASLQAHQRPALHLAVSLRSFRAEKLSDFVDGVITGDCDEARKQYAQIQSDYPILLTRDIEKGRDWLRKKARGTERYGLVASSGGIRLKPEGISVKTSIDPVYWFLNDKDDIRSSYYLEEVATEFDIQGLELDWALVCWDADFRRVKDGWDLYAFRGTQWQHVNDQYRDVYLRNAYRVLLTRARQGMVVFVPKGDDTDYTRPARFYDETYNYLLSCGIEKL
jgi:hypothetical protein